MTDGPSPTTVEQYVDGYGRVKLALSFDYDQQKVNRMNALEWDEHHQDKDDSYEFHDGEVAFAWMVDRSSEALRHLRETVGLGIPPVEEIPWNISVYPTSPGTNPRKCEACDEERVLGKRGLEASGYRRTALHEIVASEVTDAEQVCTACQQFFKYEVHESATADGGTTVTSGTMAHEVM